MKRVGGLFSLLILGACAQPPAPIDVAVGLSHSCAIDAKREVWCWGDGSRSQLGQGAVMITSRRNPVAVTGLSGALQISARGDHTCVLMPGGTAKCWGSNGTGQGGDGTTVEQRSPTAVMNLTNATQIATGVAHTCARMSDGTVRCWGDNSLQQCNSSNTTPVLTPSAVTGLTDVVEVAAGSVHSCARRTDGTVWCWGRLPADAPAPSPLQTPGVTNARKLVVGDQFTCVLRTNGVVSCLGENAVGQLGTAEPESSANAVDVDGVADAVDVWAGDRTACARRQNGEVVCWGSGYSDPRPEPGAMPPFPPRTIVRVAAPLSSSSFLAYGSSHVCAIRPDAAMGNQLKVMCLGTNNYGQLGDGTVTDRATSAPVIFP